MVLGLLGLLLLAVFNSAGFVFYSCVVLGGGLLRLFGVLLVAYMFLIWLFSDYCFGCLALADCFWVGVGYVGFWWLLCGLLWLFGAGCWWCANWLLLFALVIWLAVWVGLVVNG